MFYQEEQKGPEQAELETDSTAEAVSEGGDMDKETKEAYDLAVEVADLPNLTSGLSSIEEQKGDDGNQKKEVREAVLEARKQLGYKDDGSKPEYYISDTFVGGVADAVQPFDKANIKNLESTAKDYASSQDGDLVAGFLKMKKESPSKYKAFKQDLNTLKSGYAKAENIVKKMA